MGLGLGVGLVVGSFLANEQPRNKAWATLGPEQCRASVLRRLKWSRHKEE